mgnify:CR=1 FL=1
MNSGCRYVEEAKKQGKKLRKIRKRMGLTQDQMAVKLGYSKGARIYDIEKGRSNMSLQARKCLEYFTLLELKLRVPKYSNGILID